MRSLGLFIVLVLSYTSHSNAQSVGISSSGAAPDNTSILDLSSTSKGFLVPRMTETERDAISNPANALQIFNTTTNCLQIYISGQWMNMQCACDPPAAPVATAATSVAGSSFDANWNSSSGATTYYLDVDDNSDFSSPLVGYNNLNVGNVTTHNVTGLTCGTTYYYQVRASNSCGTGGNSNTITATGACFIVATGGTITTDGDFKIHTFNSSGTFTVQQLGTDATYGDVVWYLVIGGGGAAGSNYAGGGGAGGYQENGAYDHTVSAQAYAITVGAGGSGGNGGNSTFDVITATGGGRGGSYNAGNGVAGGSGGGAGGGNAGTSSGGAGTGGQGFAGGNKPYASGFAGGGGGGAGGVGGNSPSGNDNEGGNGGPGISSSITGTSVCRAGGGIGSNNRGGTAATATCGGADHANSFTATPNTGGGGGHTNNNNGASGVVIIRYKYQ